MKILIACEFSGIVRDAFLKMGHDAMSCDILPTESPGPHYQGDVFDIIKDGFNMKGVFFFMASLKQWPINGFNHKRRCQRTNTAQTDFNHNKKIIYRAGLASGEPRLKKRSNHDNPRPNNYNYQTPSVWLFRSL